MSVQRYTCMHEGMVVIVFYYRIMQDPGCSFKLYACKCRDVGKKIHNQLEIVLIRNKWPTDYTLYLYHMLECFFWYILYAQAQGPAQMIFTTLPMQAVILPQLTNHQPILWLVNSCTPLQKKEWLHELFSSWPAGDAHIIYFSGKFISQYALCLALLDHLCSL